MPFLKWDIVFASKFPDTVQCNKCTNNFSIDEVACSHCSAINRVSNIVAKKRPVIVWISQPNWFESMAFGIPTSSSSLRADRGNEIILLPAYRFLHTNIGFQRPMRALIAQATRIDGNALSNGEIIGQVTDTVIQQKIEDKLLRWISAG